MKIGLIIGGDIAGCMKRCMKEAKEALEAAGHTVVELQLPELGYASQLWTMITSQRRFDDFIAELNGEELEEFNRVPRVPRFVKMLFILLLRLKG